MSEIADKVKAIIVDKLSVEEAEVKPEASFANDLGADSLDTVELIMEFERNSVFPFPTIRLRRLAPWATQSLTSKSIRNKIVSHKRN